MEIHTTHLISEYVMVPQHRGQPIHSMAISPRFLSLSVGTVYFHISVAALRYSLGSACCSGLHLMSHIGAPVDCVCWNEQEPSSRWIRASCSPRHTASGVLELFALAAATLLFVKAMRRESLSLNSSLIQSTSGRSSFPMTLLWCD